MAHVRAGAPIRVVVDRVVGAARDAQVAHGSGRVAARHGLLRRHALHVPRVRVGVRARVRARARARARARVRWLEGERVQCGSACTAA